MVSANHKPEICAVQYNYPIDHQVDVITYSNDYMSASILQTVMIPDCQ